MLRAKLEVLSHTNLVDYMKDIYESLSCGTEDVIEQLTQRRNDVLKQLAESREEGNTIIEILSDKNVHTIMETTRDAKLLTNHLMKNTQFKWEYMDTVYKMAKIQYECGDYAGTSTFLYFYLLLMPPTDKNYLNVLWGKLASEILVQNWDVALEDLNKLREYMDTNSMGSSLQLLQQRTWLIHWSLFVFFNHTKGRDLIIDMFLYRPFYLNAIQTMCPHILRYLAAAVIINRSRRPALKDLVKVIQQESYAYKDPITEFVEHLYVNFDFEGARQKLHECDEVINSDFFLVACLEEFVENARLMIFETFCRIHQCISIGMLAEKLNMKPDAAECWIVNLIRQARLDAKIDSKLGYVVMGTPPLSPYEQLIEKIDTLSMRSDTLQALIERKVKEHRQESFMYG
ncbi:eukaryotic translation initiation factor 3 subunit E-like [Nilaparvata lugens]|uniref:eukaryotic translation initiation factor 3 subunit E-like n=1 Tax=Nilaparvata lugens TaxID=108931 RepID=UPI00193CAEBB|nr:eukaryotic translation initiation factor 3 subunit E-like [Nilaparvata lugens]